MMRVRVKNMDNDSSVEVEKASHFGFFKFVPVRWFFYSRVLQFGIKNQNTLFSSVPPALSSYLLINRSGRHFVVKLTKIPNFFRLHFLSILHATALSNFWNSQIKSYKFRQNTLYLARANPPFNRNTLSCSSIRLSFKLLYQFNYPSLCTYQNYQQTLILTCSHQYGLDSQKFRPKQFSGLIPNDLRILWNTRE